VDALELVGTGSHVSVHHYGEQGCRSPRSYSARRPRRPRSSATPSSGSEHRSSAPSMLVPVRVASRTPNLHPQAVGARCRSFHPSSTRSYRTPTCELPTPTRPAWRSPRRRGEPSRKGCLAPVLFLVLSDTLARTAPEGGPFVARPTFRSLSRPRAERPWSASLRMCGCLTPSPQSAAWMRNP
jgi:hypothetical protein